MRGEKKRNAVREELAVALKDLENGPYILERDIGPERFQERLQFCEYEATPISAKVKLKLENCGDGILLKGNAVAQIKSQCATCLAETVIHLKPVLSAYLTRRPDEGETPDDAELTPEDLEKEWFEGDTVSLDPIIFDAIILEMPINPKCGSTCPGLPASRPADNRKEIDPRLAPLANLKFEKES